MTVTLSTPFLNSAEQSQIRDLLRRTAKTEIMPRFQNLSAQDVSTKSRDDDLVTKADLASEAMITAELQNLFPHAVVVGEEVISKHPSLLTQMADHEICFVIDPIDGTWNFANGIPLFGIILSVLHFGRPIYGLLYDPVMDDFIEADLGHGTCDFRDAQDRPFIANRPPPRSRRFDRLHTLWPTAQGNPIHTGTPSAKISAHICVALFMPRIPYFGTGPCGFLPILHFKSMGSRGRCFNNTAVWWGLENVG